MTRFGKQNLYKILDDGGYYRLYIRRELKKRKMPAILEYLPLVESEYKPTAKSRSGAMGLWQFFAFLCVCEQFLGLCRILCQ